jgi:hypothetical protein
MLAMASQELYRAQTSATARNMLAMASHSRKVSVSAKM